MLSQQAGANLIRETFRVFNHAVSNGLGQEPDPAVSAALRENAFIFSGFKTHAELEQVSQMLVDEKGNIRPYNEFRQDVERINQDYNHNYLRTEYNQALQSAQMAGKWADFEKNKNFINLQYRTANDERVRASHRILHGTTLPVDDPFWKQYTPPNGWGCRCTVVAVPKDDYPVQDSQGSIAKAESCFKTPKEKMFKENLAEKKRLFPSKHPYLPKGCGECGKTLLAYNPKSLICKACGAIRKLFKKECESKKEYEKAQRIAENKKEWESIDTNIWNKTKFYTESGGFIAGHKLKAPDNPKDKTGGVHGENTVNDLLAKSGKRVYRLPDNVSDKTPIFGKPYKDLLKYREDGTVYGYPDDYFDGQTWDVKKIDDANENTIRSYIKDGRKADNVIMYFEREKTVLLTNAVLREAGKRKSLGELHTLPNIYLINDKGEITQFWNKKSGLVKSALGSEN